MAITSTRSASIVVSTAVVFMFVLTIAANTYSSVGSFEEEKNEVDECRLLCINEYLCSCDVSDAGKRNQCCKDYCNAKCGSGAIGSCGDLPKKPNC